MNFLRRRLGIDGALALRRRVRRLAGPLLLVADWLVGLLVGAVFVGLRLLSTRRASALGGALARGFGPLLPAHRLARANIAAAFPEKSDAERAAILREAWDNLGRMACEYVHIDHVARIDLDHPEIGRLELSPEVIDGFIAMRDDDKPALIFTAHLANWELPAVIAAQHGMASAALYRTPNNRFVARRILALRAGMMGTLIAAGPQAPFALAAAITRGEHVGMLVDQRFGRGPRINFFGRPAATNPLFARLARHYDCPVWGVRAIRLPDARFRFDLTGPIELPRDAAGQIDVTTATIHIAGIVEGWIREHPGQWLWMHNRWRP